VPPEGGTRAKVGSGDEFGPPSGTGAIFPTWRELPTLPIGSFRVGPVLVVYLESDGRRPNIGVTGGAPIFTPGPKSLLTLF
jgi:hypothetical protein